MIESVNVQSPSARGAATLYKFRARNLITKQKVDIGMKGTDSLDLADFSRRQVKFMYADAASLYFLDQGNFETHELRKEDVAEESQYLTEDTESVQVLFYNDEAVGVQLPAAVELKITESRAQRPRRLRHRPDQARHPRNRPDRPSPRIHRRRHPDQGRHPHGRIPLPGMRLAHAGRSLPETGKTASLRQAHWRLIASLGETRPRGAVSPRPPWSAPPSQPTPPTLPFSTCDRASG